VFVLLCSTKSCAASKIFNKHNTQTDRVILFDNNWNPSNDIQAACRVFRFGQQKETFIYRLYCVGTMEETIYNRQILKQVNKF
jgi:SNF2 family DNA or RNA helicase